MMSFAERKRERDVLNPTILLFSHLTSREIVTVLKYVLPAALLLVGNQVFADSPDLCLKSTDEGDFQFDTEQIQGTIRLDGAYHGVTRLVDKRTGRQVIDSRYSALNLFKLMSVNQAMGQPRNMERTTQVSSRWVEATWSATDDHRGEIAARYELVEANAIDLTVTVRSEGVYRDYELFVSNYFDKVLRPHVYLQSRSRQPPQLVVPMVNDVFRGAVLVFPRDPHSARLCLDGRWERNERNTPIVQMCPVRRYAHCLAFLTDPDEQIGVALMSRPGDCYAISTRYHADDDADRLTTYSAFDFSLFGDDLLPGIERTVKVRMALISLDGDPDRPLKAYQAFSAEMNRRSDQDNVPEKPAQGASSIGDTRTQ
jgi:hypothetical protein